MDYYSIEKTAESLTGKITCGSKIGYCLDSREFNLGWLIQFINETNKEIIDEGSITLPCIIQEGTLIGRANTKDYCEKVYNLNFLHSPRSNPIDSETFYNTLLMYADKIGNKMQQERMYVEFDGNTTIIRNNKSITKN